MKFGEFKNARNITNRVLDIIEKNHLEVVSLNIHNANKEEICVNFVVKYDNNFNCSLILKNIQKEFRYSLVNEEIDIEQINNYIDISFDIK
jgi:hypothetical protein